MDSNLIITGAMGKYYNDYRAKKNSEELGHPDRSLIKTKSNRLIETALPQAGELLMQLKEKTTNVASNVATLHKKFSSSKNMPNQRIHSVRSSRTLEPMHHGDIVYVSPVLNEEGYGLCMMSSTLITERTCVNFWQDENDRANPFAGLYRIGNVNCGSIRDKDANGVSRKRGSETIIKQGEAVTFRLLLSQKYLCADVGNYADIERNFIKLGLTDKENDISAQFSICTRFNSRSGNPVFYEDQIFISHELSQLEVRMGDMTSTYGSSYFSYGINRRVEVNLGQMMESNDSEQFFWTISKYCSQAEARIGGDAGVESGNADKIAVGSCVSIHYPHKDAYLWGSLNSSTYDMFGPKTRSGKFYNKNPEFVFKGNSLYPFKNAFVIENLSSLRGGEVFRDGLYRLRHMASNTYMCIEKNESSNALATRLCKLTETSKDSERKQFLLSSIFQLHTLVSDEEKNNSSEILSKSTFLHIVHPNICMLTKMSSMRYDQVVSNLLAGSYSIDGQDEVSILTMGPTRGRKKKEYLYLVSDNTGGMFHIPPQNMTECRCASEVHKASAVFSRHPEDYDVLALHKIDGGMVEYFAKIIEEHSMFNSLEADFYQYALLSKAKQKCIAPCRPDTLFETRALLSSYAIFENVKTVSSRSNVDLSTYNIYDQEDFIKSVQKFSCISRFIDRTVLLLHFPHALQLTWTGLCQQLESLAEILFLLQKVVLKSGENNSFVQEYLARGKMKGHRTLHVDVVSEAFSAVDASSLRQGYFSIFVRGLLIDEARESSCQLLQELLYKNVKLSKYFTCRGFIGFVANIIKRRGPSRELLQLLACVVSGSGVVSTINGEVILEVLCSTHSDPIDVDSRVMTLIETVQHDDTIYIAWNGSSRYVTHGVDVDYFFFGPQSLGVSSSDLPLSTELAAYFMRRGVAPHTARLQGVPLEDVAWFIDPPVLCRFWDQKGPPPAEAWSLMLKKHRNDTSFLVKASRLGELLGHYLGMISLYKELCKESVQGVQYLERQFSFRMIGGLISSPRLPLCFRGPFIELMKNLYVERYPFVVQPYPNCIRTRYDFDSICNLEEALDSGRINRDQFDSSEVADTHGMQEEVTFLDQANDCHTMSYREYLLKFQPETVCTDGNKFKEIQDLVFRYFFEQRTSACMTRYLQSAGKEAVEVLRFECTCLDLVASLTSRGFYSTRKRLAEGLKVSFIIIQSNNTTAAAIKHNDEKNIAQISSPFTTSGQRIRDNMLGALSGLSGPVDNDMSSDEGEGDDDSTDSEEDTLVERQDSVEKRGSYYVFGEDLDETSQEEESESATLLNAENYEEEPNSVTLGVRVSRISRQHDLQYPPASVTECVFENQRWSGVKYVPNLSLHPLGPFNSSNPLFAQLFKAQHPNDRLASDTSGLPDAALWQWTGPWKVEVTQNISRNGQEVSARALDEEGWFYAFDWPAEFRPEPKNFYSYVRRRKWLRTMTQLTAVKFFERLLAAGHSKEALHDACVSQGCIGDSGKVDFSKVLSNLLTPSVLKKSDFSLPTRSRESAEDELRKASVLKQKTKGHSSSTQQLWLETLAKSCRIMNIAYDVILNARMTFFCKHLIDSPPPRRKSSSAGSDMEPIWHLVDIEANKTLPMLSCRGATIFRGLFSDLSCVKLIFGDDEDASQTYVSNIIKLVMENHHDLCGGALTVLRREFSQVSDLKVLLKQALIVTSEDHCKRYEVINVILNCLQADSESFLAINLANPMKLFSLPVNITDNVSKLNQALSGSQCSLLQDAICIRQGHVPLTNILLKSLIMIEKISTCSALCAMFDQISTFLCKLCTGNIKSKRSFHRFTSSLMQVFRYGTSERGCACVHNACIRVLSTAFHDIDFDSTYFPIAAVPMVVAYLDPDFVRPSALMQVTSLVKDIICPNRKLVIAAYQPVVLKAMLRATRNKTMFFEDSAFKSRSQVDKRLAYLADYGESHDLYYSAATVSDSDSKTSVALLFHTECVEILALCCEEVSNHINTKLSSLLSVDTLLTVMADESAGAVRCPPLMYSYGLFLYRVFLKNSDNSRQGVFSDSFFSSPLKWKLVEVFCSIAYEPSSLHNSYRPFIFDVAMPTIECVLRRASQPDQDGSPLKSTRSIRKRMQELLQSLLSASISIEERLVVEDSCMYFNVSVAAAVASDPSPVAVTDTDVASISANPLPDDFMGIYDSDEKQEFVYEMASMEEDSSPAAATRMTREELSVCTVDLIDNCSIFEQVRKETGTDQLIEKLMAMEINEGELTDSSSSVTSERSTDNTSTTGSLSPSKGSFFCSLVKRLTMYAMKVITSIGNNDCSMEALENVKLVFDIFTATLRTAREKNSQSKELEDLQHLINNNFAGQLIIEVISLPHSEGVGRGDNKALVDHALLFGGELLFNGNRQCQQSLLDLMRGENSVRMNGFFSSITKSVKCYTEVIRSMVHSRNGIKEVDMTGDITSSAKSETHYIEVLARAQSTFTLLQLLCEGHFLEMQEVFESAQIGYHLLTMTALLCEQILPINIDVSHLLRCELLVGFNAMDFLIEAVQGPCTKNQDIIAGNDRFISVLGRWSSSKLSIESDSIALLVARRPTYTVRLNNSSMFDPVDFFSLKLMKNKCLILRLGLLEGRSMKENIGNLRAMHEKYKEGDDPSTRLQAIYQEYRVAKKIGRKLMLEPERGRTVYRLIKSEAHLTLSYYTALKRWLPSVLGDITPLSMAVVRRKHIGSEVEYQAAQRQYRKLEKYKRVYHSYMDRQRNIEVSWLDKGLFQISFQKPRQCEFMTEEIKHRVKNLIEHDNDDRVSLFLNNYKIDEISTALICLSFLINFIMAISMEKGYFTGHSRPQYSREIFLQLMTGLQIMQVVGYFISLLQTLILMSPVARDEWYELVAVISATTTIQLSKVDKMLAFSKHYTGLILAVISVVIVNTLLLLRFKEVKPVILLISCLVLMKSFFHCFMASAREPHLAKSAAVGWVVIGLNVVTATKTLTMIFFSTVALLCLNPKTPYFNSIMLLAIAFKSPTLQNVIKSVTIPFTSLALSTLLGMICIFIFTIFGFFFFPEEFYNEDQSVDECSNVLMCFVTFLHGGFLSGGGIADHLSDLGHEPVRADAAEFSLRVIYDIFFFVMIIILLLNIIFGIIIDTFGSLREEQQEQHRLETSFCFICGIAKEEFDTRALDATATGGAPQLDFAGHVKQEHNMWDYMYFRIYLSLRDPNVYNGVESYIADLTREDDISWVPKGKTLGINDVQEDGAESEKRMQKELNQLSATLQKSLNRNFEVTAQSQQSGTAEMRDMLNSMKGGMDLLKTKVEELSNRLDASDRPR